MPGIPLALLTACALHAASAPLALVEPRPVTEAAGWGEIAWAPAGDRLSVHGQGRLWVVSLADGAREPVAPSAGQRVFRHGFPGVEPGPGPVAWAARDDIWLRDDHGERRLTQGEDRFYDPVLAPDGRRIAFSGLITGLHVMDLDSGRPTHLGPGRWPGWHPDGWLIFERNSDDGHELTAAELMLWHPSLGAPMQLTDDPATLDRFPSLSPDGERIAWIRDGAVWVARLEEVAP